MLPFTNVLSTNIELLLKEPMMKSYIDKRIVSGIRVYYDKLSARNHKDVSFSKPMLNRALTPVYCNKLVNVIKQYKRLSGQSDDVMAFYSYCVATAITTMLKIVELGDYISGNESGDMFIGPELMNKMVGGVSLIEDLDSNFSAYAIAPKKADLRYLEMGLKRLMLSQMDAVV